MTVAGRDEHMPREDLLAVGRFLYPQRAAFIQASGESGTEGPGDVLGNDRAGCIRR